MKIVTTAVVSYVEMEINDILGGEGKLSFSAHPLSGISVESVVSIVLG